MRGEPTPTPLAATRAELRSEDLLFNVRCATLWSAPYAFAMTSAVLPTQTQEGRRCSRIKGKLQVYRAPVFYRPNPDHYRFTFGGGVSRGCQ